MRFGEAGVELDDEARVTVGGGIGRERAREAIGINQIVVRGEEVVTHGRIGIRRLIRIRGLSRTLRSPKPIYL